MGVDGDVFQKTAGAVHRRQLGAGAQAGIDAQHPLAACRRGQKQVAQVAAEDPDGHLVGQVLGLQAQFHLDGRGDQALVGIFGHPLQERL